MLLLATLLLATPPDLASKQAFSVELWRIAEAGGATCRPLEEDGVATGHECQWPDGTLLARAEYADGYRHFLYYRDGAVQTECVLAEGWFDCAEWDEDGRRLSPYQVAADAHARDAEITLRELEATSETRAAFTVLVREVWQAHAADSHRIRATTLLDQARQRRMARAGELAAMGFLELEVAAILREEERGGPPVDARPLSERGRPSHARVYR